MKSILLLLLLVTYYQPYAQPDMLKVEWVPYFDYYKGEGGLFHKGKIYDSHVIAVNERIDVYDATSGKKLYDTSLTKIKLEDFKKPKHLDFYGFFKEDGEAYLVTRNSASKGQKDIFIIPLDETSNILKSEMAEEADEGFDLQAIFDLEGNEVRTNRYLALLEARYLGNEEYSGEETSLLVLDVLDDKLVLEDHIEKGSEYSKFWNGRFFLSDTYSAYSYDGQLHVDDCESSDELELNLRTHFSTSLNPRLIAFKKTKVGFVAVVDESRKSDDFEGAKDFSGQIHRLILNEDLEIVKDKTVNWDLTKNDLGIKRVSRKIHISDEGDVFIASDGNRTYGMDIFGISSDGQKWVRSIPFNHGNTLTYSEHNKNGTGIQMEVYQQHLYIAYGDNRKNLTAFDYNAYKRPEKELDTHSWSEAQNKVITILKVDASGKIEIFEVVDEANSDIHLTNLSIEAGTIHLHGAKGLRHKTAFLKL